MTELSHKERLEQSERLLSELDIREGLRGKLFYLYPETFQMLHSVFAGAEEFDWLIMMHAIQAASGVRSGNTITYHIHAELSFNAQLILQDIFDDYWACCLCFQCGFTKQAQAILRSTLELTTQLYYLKHLNQSGTLTSDSWALGTRGIEKFRDKIDLIKSMGLLNSRALAPKLDSIYNRLCTSTHSRKDRLAASNLPRLERAKDMPSFEPIEILYTKGLFCSVLDLELKMIKFYLDDEPETMWIGQLRGILSKMLERLSKMQRCINSFEKGYIIHREHVNLSNNKQILYSINLDKVFEFPGRNKPKLTQAQAKEFRKKVEMRVVKDIN